MLGDDSTKKHERFKIYIYNKRTVFFWVYVDCKVDNKLIKIYTL